MSIPKFEAGQKVRHTHGDVKILAIADGYVMARRPGVIPFVIPEMELRGMQVEEKPAPKRYSADCSITYELDGKTNTHYCVSCYDETAQEISDTIAHWFKGSEFVKAEVRIQPDELKYYKLDAKDFPTRTVTPASPSAAVEVEKK